MKVKQQSYIYSVFPLIAALSVLGGCAGNKPQSENVAGNDVFAQAMSEQDLVLADESVQKALQTRLSGKSITWRNPATGHRGTVTPVRSYKTKNGYFCREYRETVIISGQTRQYRDTACRDRDGIWKPL